MTKRIPGATYRLQFNRDFTFARARQIAGYLHDLGITDCYASPLFKACSYSTHGYDVCDFGQLNPNLGSSHDLENLTARLQEFDIGLILDLVPNHMSTDTSNSWWFDVLENGPTSKYSSWFDIDWQRFGDSKVVLPILEDHFDNVLFAGTLRLVSEGPKFFVTCHDRKFPLSPDSQAALVTHSAQHGLDALLCHFNGSPGRPTTFRPLNELLEKQYYKLAYWNAGRINYRRFFDVNELVSLRMQSTEVFEATHQLVCALVHQGKVTGLRIDHPDGLWNPKQYLQRLQQKLAPIYVVVEKILTDDEALPTDWQADGTTGYDFLNRLNGLFVDQRNRDAFDRLYHEFCGHSFDFSEMVYDAKKRLLQTSFQSELDVLARRLQEIARSTSVGQRDDPGQLRDALVEALASFPVYRTYVTEDTAEITAVETQQIAAAIDSARARQSCPAPASEHDPLGFIHELLLLRATGGLDQSSKIQRREFIMSFQQLTGPLMAKALEDTTFYNFNRLISLNEVGGNPNSFGHSVGDFHEHNLQKLANWPHSLLTTATHDTKRGEDLRARINVLSELPEEWHSALGRWQKLNADSKSMVNGQPAPDSNDEYSFYQTLIGAWPTLPLNPQQFEFFRQRLLEYMLKALKESKTHTSWTQPNLDYELAASKFVEKTLQDSSANTFLEDFKSFQARVAFFGRLNSLSQVLLKMTAPGVPDFYQGAELWDFNLVDPDNRRPVDYELRRRLLSELKARFNEEPIPCLLAALLRDDQLGLSKLYLIWRALEFRNCNRTLFDDGAYQPLTAIGKHAQHLCAFARLQGNAVAIVVAPRLLVGLAKSECRLPLGPELWDDSQLLLPDSPISEFRNILTNEKVSPASCGSARSLSVGQILKHFPVALLEGHVETR